MPSIFQIKLVLKGLPLSQLTLQCMYIAVCSYQPCSDDLLAGFWNTSKFTYCKLVPLCSL